MCKRFMTSKRTSCLCHVLIYRWYIGKILKKKNKRTDLDDLNLRPSTGKTSEDAPFLVPIQLARRMETNLSSEKQRNLEKFTQPWVTRITDIFRVCFCTSIYFKCIVKVFRILDVIMYQRNPKLPNFAVRFISVYLLIRKKSRSWLSVLQAVKVRRGYSECFLKVDHWKLVCLLSDMWSR